MIAALAPAAAQEGKSSGAGMGNAGPGYGNADPIRNTSPGSDIISYDISKIEARRRAAAQEAQSKQLPIDTQINASNAQLQQLQAIPNPTADQQAQILSLNQSLVQMNYQKNVIAQTAQYQDQFFQNEIETTRHELDIPPYLQIVYRNQDALLGEAPLRSLTRELVSYAGVSVSGPAGLVVGSLVGSFVGGKLDKMFNWFRDIERAKNAPLPDLVKSLQAVCTWNETVGQLYRGLTDAKSQQAREKEKTVLFAKIAEQEKLLAGCERSYNSFVEHKNLSEQLFNIVFGRVSAGTVKNSDDFKSSKALADLIPKLPADLMQKLKVNDFTTVKLLAQELNRQKANAEYLVDIYSPEKIAKSRVRLAELKRGIEALYHDPSETELSNTKAMVTSARFQLQKAEIDLNSMVYRSLEARYKDYLAKIDDTYKKDSSTWKNARLQAGNSYRDALIGILSRQKEIERQSLAEIPMAEAIKDEQERKLRELVDGSPLLPIR